MSRLRLFASLVFLLGMSVTPLAAHAATADAVLHITPDSGSYSAGDTLTATISLDSPTSAVSAVDVVLDTSNLTYVSSDFSGSVMSEAITPLAQDGSTISFTYGRLDTGYTGTGGTVGVLTFTVGSDTPTLSIDQTDSQVLAYSDSSQILASVTNPTYTLADASSATPTPTASPDPTLPDTGTNVNGFAIGGGVLLVLAFLVTRQRKAS